MMSSNRRENAISPIKIDHTYLFVSSLARAQNYYETLFDFTLRPREGNPQILCVESPAVHFFITEVSGIDREFLAQQHISFQVDDLSVVMAKLRAFGIEECRTGQVDFFQHRNYKWCEWRDPDGIRVECVELV